MTSYGVCVICDYGTVLYLRLEERVTALDTCVDDVNSVADRDVSASLSVT